MIGNTSTLLWWPSDLDLINTNEIQKSHQFLLTAQLVNFVTPDKPSLVGGITTAQVLDLNFDEYVRSRMREMQFPLKMVPSARISLLLTSLAFS